MTGPTLGSSTQLQYEVARMKGSWEMNSDRTYATDHSEEGSPTESGAS